MNIRNVKQLGARIANGARNKNSLTVDAATIRELSELISETGLTEIEIEAGGQRIRVARHAASVIQARTEGAYPNVMWEPVRTESARGDGGAARRDVIAGT